MPDLVINNGTPDVVQVRFEFTPDDESIPTFTDSVELQSGEEMEYDEVPELDQSGVASVTVDGNRNRSYEYSGFSGLLDISITSSDITFRLITA